MAVAYDHDATVLRGPVVDQAALHGLLARVRDIGMPLLSIIRMEPEHLRHHEPAEPCDGSSATHHFDPLTGDRP